MVHGFIIKAVVRHKPEFTESEHAFPYETDIRKSDEANELHQPEAVKEEKNSSGRKKAALRLSLKTHVDYTNKRLIWILFGSSEHRIWQSQK